jgi:hypothetical protein
MSKLLLPFIMMACIGINHKMVSWTVLAANSVTGISKLCISCIKLVLVARTLIVPLLCAPVVMKKAYC